MSDGDGLYIVLISLHGLLRANNLELGRDSDTGGQIKYVVELGKTLAKSPAVQRIDILTRLIEDQKVSSDYAQPLEKLSSNAFIVRLRCGPKRYIRKEVLWPYLDNFLDNALQHIRRVGKRPDIVHSHYADAGYIGARLAGILNIPLIHTGHSLGRVKLQRLLDDGLKVDFIEKQYNIQRRIEAEEIALDNAALVIASTSQEVEEQYNVYDNYQPKNMRIIPPGVELTKFYPPSRTSMKELPIKKEINRFLKDTSKPIILGLSRPDPRKNIKTLLHAFGKKQKLREQANLVIIAGNRDNINSLETVSKKVLTEILMLVDLYDLYGHVAYPKSHKADDVPDLYRIVTKSRGAFINPALTEPFGLTLIEAAASGLPIVATEDGGPRDIINYCKNGLLINPLDEDAIANALLKVISDKNQWIRWSKNGIMGAHKYFSWNSHVKRYLQEVNKLTNNSKKRLLKKPVKNRLLTANRVIICDIDNTLLGDRKGLEALISKLNSVDDNIGFGIATGRRINSALKILKEWKVPIPDVLITGVGSEIHYGPRIIEDTSWQRHINYRWKPQAILESMKGIKGVILQPENDQGKHKISYYIDSQKSPSIRKIASYLRKNNLYVNVIFSHGEFLDILPIRVSKGSAVRYFALKWGLPFEHILVAGDSGNDEEMLRGNTLSVVVGNYSSELEKLRGESHIYFAEGHYSWGILEGINYFNFFTNSNNKNQIN